MNPMDFLQGINDIDDELIRSSAELLIQEDNKHTFLKGGRTISKIILVAAIVSGILGVTAFATELFPSVFGELQREYAQVPTELLTERGIEEREVLDRAVAANQGFEAEYVPLPEFNDSQIIIGETYYDGDHFLIAYRLDENAIPVQFGFGPDSEGFDRLWPCKSSPDALDIIEEFKDIWPQEDYEMTIAARKNEGLEFVRHLSNFGQLSRLDDMVSEEEYEAFLEELKEVGHAGYTYRTIFISDHILCEGEDCLLPNKNGELWGEEMTDSGRIISCDVFDEILPERFKALDQLTLTLRVKAVDTTVYIDLENGASSFGDGAGVIEVPVTLTRVKP